MNEDERGFRKKDGATGIDRRISALICGFIFLSVAEPVLAADGSWASDSSGNWSDPGKWVGGVIASGANFTAYFTNNISATRYVTNGYASLEIGRLYLNSAANNFSFRKNTIILTNATTPEIYTGAGDHTIYCPIAGGQGVSKTGGGIVRFYGTNTYKGVTTVSTKVLVVANSKALGDPVDGTVVASGVSVATANGIVVTGETIAISGYGDGSGGALRTASGCTSTWTGPILLGPSGRIGTGEGYGKLTVSGTISDGADNDLYISGNLTTNVGNGTVVLSGTNNYSGNTTIVRGIVRLDGGDNRLPVTTVLDLWAAATNDTASLDLNGFNQTVAGLGRDYGPGVRFITNGSVTSATLTVNQSFNTNFGGRITGNLNLAKTGAGSLALLSTNDYTGLTLISNGVLGLTGPVCLATNTEMWIWGSGVCNLNFAGTQTVYALYMDGVPRSAGVYGSNDTAQITGSGFLLSVWPPPSGTVIGIR